MPGQARVLLLQGMANNTKKSSSRNNDARVVFTGKRVEGTWSLESALPATSRASKKNNAMMRTDNQRSRTLH